MKIFKSKEFYKNLAFVAFLAIVLIPNPVGKELKVLVSKLRVMVLNPSVESTDNQKQLSKFDYEWKLVDANGKQVELSDFSGKVILLNYWATWCPPCVAEMPSLQKLYNDYQDKMVFIFLTNDDKPKVDAFMKKRDLTLPVYFQHSKAPAKLFTSSLPTTYLIDQNGKILIEEVGASDWNGTSMRDILDKLLVE
ncbi:MAG: TlpA family protein disulfide reductase [Flavobacteriales bacterium]|nr:TlpA family protein disulfide reductase [Flavobacteriales bacterium]